MRLVKGGQVILNGHRVRMEKAADGYVATCPYCKMYHLCMIHSDMYNVCLECDKITFSDNYLQPATNI